MTDAYVEGYAVPLRVRAAGLSPAEVVAATTDGKRRLDALRARYAEFQRAEEAISASRRAATASRGRPHDRDRRPRRRRQRARAARCSASTCTGPCCSPCAASPMAAKRLRGRSQRARARAQPRRGRAARVRRSTRWRTRSRPASRSCAWPATACRGSSQHASAMISVKDADGRYLLVGRRWEEVSGRRAADVIGRTDAELMPGRHAAPSRAADLQVIRTGEPARVRARLDHHRGHALVPDRQVPAQGRRRRGLRRRHDGHRRLRPQARARRRGRGLALEVRVPGQHEPRDPHAAERRDRDDRAAAPDRALARAARLRPDRRQRPARRCSA